MPLTRLLLLLLLAPMTILFMMAKKCLLDTILSNAFKISASHQKTSKKKKTPEIPVVVVITRELRAMEGPFPNPWEYFLF